ncbi:MAG: HAMP domain-containing histidine kinase, partial [Clostridia bacterium]|nr:HAMP domain-containing histidine kinase [Clostridia bacterium]
EKTDRLQSDFISNVSHELKTPVSVILGYCELLKDESLTLDTRQKYIQTIIDSSMRLSMLITNVLQLTKLENQKIRPEISVFSLDNSLSECVISYEELLERKGLCFECDFDRVKINSCKSLLEIVWNNLISNAIKFTDSGSIKISLKREKSLAKITVSDSGCGISPQIGERIFDKFYQGETSHSKEGNGLGLAMVKKVIEILGGQITVESEVNVGTTFTVLLSGVINE